MKRLSMLLAAALLAGGCPESKPDAQDEVGGQPGQDVHTPGDDAAPDQTHQPLELIPRCLDGEPGAHVVIVNADEVDLYIPIEFLLTIERMVDGEPIAHKTEHACIPVCQGCEVYFCEACDPAVRILEPGETRPVDWNGELYQDNLSTCTNEEFAEEVSCLDRFDATPGTYRARVCFSKDYTPREENFGGCWGSDGVVSPASLGDVRCVSTEFAYDGCTPPTVEVPLSFDAGVEP